MDINSQSYLSLISQVLTGSNQSRQQAESVLQQFQSHPDFVAQLMQILDQLIQQAQSQTQNITFSLVLLKTSLTANFRTKDQHEQETIQKCMLQLYEKIMDNNVLQNNQQIVKTMLVIIRNIVTSKFPKCTVLELIVNQNLLTQNEQIVDDKNNRILKLVYKVFRAVDKQISQTHNANHTVYFKTFLEQKYLEIVRINDIVLERLNNCCNSVVGQTSMDVIVQMTMISDSINLDCLLLCLKFQKMYCQYLGDTTGLIDQLDFYHKLYKLLFVQIKSCYSLCQLSEHSIGLLVKLRQMMNIQLEMVSWSILNDKMKIEQINSILKTIDNYYLQSNDNVLITKYIQQHEYWNNQSSIEQQYYNLKQRLDNECVQSMITAENKNVMQVMQIINLVIENETYSGQGILFNIESTHQTVQVQVELEDRFKKEYLQKTLDFVLGNTLIISEKQLVLIEENGEQSFSDNIQSNISEELREYSTNLIRTVLEYIDQEVLVNQIQNYLENHYKQHDNQTNLGSILQTEAIYYLLAKIYKQVDAYINFEQIMARVVNDLETNRVLCINISQLQLIEQYLEYAYKIDEGIKQKVFRFVIDIQKQQNIYIRLNCILILTVLFQRGIVIMDQLSSIFQNVFELLQQVQLLDSKVSILELLDSIVKLYDTDCYSSQILTILEQQWCDTNNYQSICLKNQVLQIVNRLVLKQQLCNQQFVLQIIKQSVGCIGEPQLNETGLKLLNIYVQITNHNKSNGIVSNFDHDLFVCYSQQILECLTNNEHCQQELLELYFSVLSEYILYSDHQLVQQIGKIVVINMNRLEDELKCNAYVCLFDVFELCCMVAHKLGIPCWKNWAKEVMEFLSVLISKQTAKQDKVLLTHKQMQLYVRWIITDSQLGMQMIADQYIELINKYSDNILELEDVQLIDYKMLVVFITNYFESLVQQNEMDILSEQLKQLNLEQKNSIIGNTLLSIVNILIYIQQYFDKSIQIDDVSIHPVVYRFHLNAHRSQNNVVLSQLVFNFLKNDQLMQKLSSHQIVNKYWNMMQPHLNEQTMSSVKQQLVVLQDYQF